MLSPVDSPVEVPRGCELLPTLSGGIVCFRGGKGYGIMADWCDHGYSFTKGQAITGRGVSIEATVDFSQGMPHWPLWCGGGVPDKFIKIDPDVHFNLQVRLESATESIVVYGRVIVSVSDGMDSSPPSCKPTTTRLSTL